MGSTTTVIAISIGVLGFLPLLLVLWKRNRIKKLKETGDRVTGVVEDIKIFTGHKGNRYCQAIIRYPVFGGRMLLGTYTYTYFAKRPLFTKGQQVTVHYNKAKPEKFIPGNVPTLKGFLIFTIIIAGGYLVLCYFLFDYMKKSQ